MKDLEKMPKPLREAVKKYLDKHHGLPEVITTSVTEKAFSNNQAITYYKAYVQNKNMMSVFWYCKSNIPELSNSDNVQYFCMFADDIQEFVNNAKCFEQYR